MPPELSKKTDERGKRMKRSGKELRRALLDELAKLAIRLDDPGKLAQEEDETLASLRRQREAQLNEAARQRAGIPLLRAQVALEGLRIERQLLHGEERRALAPERQDWLRRRSLDNERETERLREACVVLADSDGRRRRAQEAMLLKLDRQTEERARLLARQALSRELRQIMLTIARQDAEAKEETHETD